MVIFNYRDLITIENLFQAWSEFKKGKRNKFDVQLFERDLEDNLFELHRKLALKIYRHGSYQDFYISDPKKRHIHKAKVQDRIVHHLLYLYLYELFDKTFIYDSYSCRLNKGTHRGVKRLAHFARKVSKSYKRDCWALKCDIKKFFSNVDHKILLELLKTKASDRNIIWLLEQIITSFHSEEKGKGIPLGNLTSQVFANIYLNELDKFIKHRLKLRYCLRYADDFIILSDNRESLFPCINMSQQFLKEELKLELHPDKIIIRKPSWGIDFLGYNILPHYILPRTKTKRRIFLKIEEKLRSYYKGEIERFSFDQTLASYTGYLSHANTYKLTQKLLLPGGFSGPISKN